MIPKKTDRHAVVRALLELSEPLDSVVVQLTEMDWDYDGKGVELTVQHLISVLSRYLAGELSSCDVENWANQIEGREDIHFELSHEKEVDSVLYELANPTLTQPLDPIRAKSILEAWL